MAADNPYTTADFHYYFAIDRGDYQRFHKQFDGHDILVSYVYLTERRDKKGAFLEMLKKHNGQVMIDSGGFTNFTTPGTVRFEEWVDFMKSNKEWVDEYIQFDDLGSRKNTLLYYETAKKEGLDPHFVDHLWFKDQGEVEQIWADRGKLAMSGFAKTLPGQRTFPGDPNKRLQEAFKRGREKETVNHLLAVGSLRKFMPNLDRIHSVDSAAWDKSAVFGKVLMFVWDEIKGHKVPIIRAFDHPGARVKRRAIPPDLKKTHFDRVLRRLKATGDTMPVQAKRVSLDNLQRYADAIRIWDPTPMREALEAAEAEKNAGVKKSLSVYFDRAPSYHDGRVPDFVKAADDLHIEVPEPTFIQKAISAVTGRKQHREPARWNINEEEAEEIGKGLGIKVDIEKRKPWLTYYFATSPNEIAKHFIDQPTDILVSFVHMVKRGKKERRVFMPDALKKFRDENPKARIMLDSGGFTNFTKPGTVQKGEYLEFLAEHRDVFSEYVMFDDLRSRETTLENYAEMRKLDLDPLFVNHLWLEGGQDVVDKIWQEQGKVCLSGFALTATDQERFPGHRKEALQEAMLKGQEVDTVVHLLAASSIRRFVKFADRIDSVDSSSWAKAGAFGMFLHLEFTEKNGVMIPTQKVYDQPENRRKQQRRPDAKAMAKIVKEQKRFQKGVSVSKAWTKYSIDQTRKYVAALNALDQKAIVQAHGEEVAQKRFLDDARPVFFDMAWGSRDLTDVVELGEFELRTDWKDMSIPQLAAAQVSIEKRLGEEHVVIKGGVDYLDEEYRGQLRAVQHELACRENPEMVGVSKMMSYWRNKDAAAYAARLRAELGEPNGNDYSETHACWEDIGGLRRIKVKDQSIPYDVPAPHRVFVGAYMNLRVPPEIVGQIAAITRAIEIDGLMGYVEARCDTVTRCAAALGWVEELIKGTAQPTLEDYTARITGNVTPEWYPSSMRAIDIQSEQAQQSTEKAPRSGQDVGTIQDVGEPVVEPEVKAETEKSEAGEYDVQMSFPISKVDDEKRLVTGIVLEPNEVDAQNDTITPETIEASAHRFLTGYNQRTRMGLMHKIFGKIGVELTESWIAREDGDLGGEPVKAGSWLMTVKVTDDNLWHKIKSGAITGFSIGGVATVA